MPTVFTASLNDGLVVRHIHFSLVAHYLDIAQLHADPACQGLTIAHSLSRAIVAITFSAMSLEAFANEAAEDVFSESDLKAFIGLTGRFRKAKNVTGIGHKIATIFSEKGFPSLPDELLADIDDVVGLRNSLVHYKLSDTAARLIFPPAKSINAQDGSTMWCIDLEQAPDRIEAPFLSKVNEASAIRSYNTVYDVARHWCVNQNIPDGPIGFARLG